MISVDRLLWVCSLARVLSDGAKEAGFMSCTAGWWRLDAAWRPTPPRRDDEKMKGGLIDWGAAEWRSDRSARSNIASASVQTHRGAVEDALVSPALRGTDGGRGKAQTQLKAVQKAAGGDPPEMDEPWWLQQGQEGRRGAPSRAAAAERAPPRLPHTGANSSVG